MFSFQYKSFPSSSFTNEPSNTPSWRGGRVCACLLILLNPSCCCGKSLLKWDNNYLPECREKKEFNFKMLIYRTSLVVQWIRIRLPGLPWWLRWSRIHCQGRGHSLNPWSGKIPTQARGPIYWAQLLQLLQLSLQSPSSTAEAAAVRSRCTTPREQPRAPQLERARWSNKGSAQPQTNEAVCTCQKNKWFTKPSGRGKQLGVFPEGQKNKKRTFLSWF